MRILSVDDHQVIRSGLKHVLREMDPDAELLEAGTIDEAIACLDGLDAAPDLILLDLLLPGTDGFEGLERLRAYDPDVPVVIMSMIDGQKEILELIQNGASGFIPKSSDSKEIQSIVRRVLDGEIYVPRLTRDGETRGGAALSARRGLGGPVPRDVLTQRQLEVLGLLALGRSNADIAAALALSENTVRIHVSAILKALKASNRTEAALIAREHDGRKIA